MHTTPGTYICSCSELSGRIIRPWRCKPELSYRWLRIGNAQILGHCGPIARRMACHGATGGDDRGAYGGSFRADEGREEGVEPIERCDKLHLGEVRGGDRLAGYERRYAGEGS